MSDAQNANAASNQAEEAAIVPGKTDGSTPAERKLDPNLKRNLMVIGGVLGGAVLIVGFMFTMLRSNDGPGKSHSDLSSVSKAETATTPSAAGMTPQMKQKIEAKQVEEAEAARRAGKTYIPQDIATTAVPENLRSHGQGEAAYSGVVAPMMPHQGYSSGVNPGQQAQSAAPSARDQARIAAMERMLPSALGLTHPEAEHVAITARAAAVTAASASKPGATPVAGSPAADAPIIVQAMDIAGAKLASEFDSDKGTYISAEILTGPAKGAFLVGSATLAGEGINMAFTGMKFNGKAYAVAVMGLDTQTANAAVDGNVDRKVFDRYVFPILMAYTGAYATARAQVATTAGTDGALGFGISKPAPTAAQAAAAGTAAAVSIASQETAKRAAAPVRVWLPTGTPIGIIFKTPVVQQ